MIFIEKNIGEIAELIKTGKTPPSKNESYYNGEINWYTPGDLDKEKFLNRSNRTITEQAIIDKKATIVPANSVLIGAIGDIGKIGVTTVESCSNQQITAVLTNHEVHFEYFYYWLKFNKSLLKSKAKNAILPILNNEVLRSIKIKYPKEIDDQKRIAKVLSDCEALIQKRRQSIELLDELLKNTFMDFFKNELNDNNNDNWITLGSTIELLADYHANGSYESLNAKINIKTERDFALMVRTTDLEKKDFETDCRYLNEEEYNYLEKSKIFGNEIIITKIGSAGNVYLMPELNRPVSLGMNAFLLRIKSGFDPKFIYGFLTTSKGKSSIMKNVKGAVTKTITKDAVRSIKIPKVHLNKQNDYKLLVEQIEPIQKRFINSLNELQNLFESLSQRAFKGQLDLSKVDVSAMNDEKKKLSSEVKDDTTLSEEKQVEDKNKIIDKIKEVQNDGSYLIPALQTYIEYSKEALSKANAIIRAGSEDFNSLVSVLFEVDLAGSLVVDHINTLTPWQVNQHSYVERYVKHLRQELIDKYPNINLFSRREFDYSTMSLEEYRDVPDEVVGEYGRLRLGNDTMDLNFFFRKYFSHKTFTIEEVEELYNKIVYDEGDWFKYKPMKEFIFEAMKGDDAFITQVFEEQIDPDNKEMPKKLIKLKLIE